VDAERAEVYGNRVELGMNEHKPMG
jgi:hypothetical protein